MSVKLHVVDDSATIQKVIKIAFSQFDVEIICSHSYIEALHAIQQNPPQLLIADAGISGNKSLDDIRKLQDASQGAPVLLLRGTYDGIDDDTISAAGFTHILRKPFESHDIVSIVQNLISLESGGHVTVPPPPPVAPQSPPKPDFSMASVTAPPPPPPPPVGSGLKPDPENPGVFVDLSDTAGREVPLPPPVRESAEPIAPPQPQSFEPPPPPAPPEPPRPPVPEMSDTKPNPMSAPAKPDSSSRFSLDAVMTAPPTPPEPAAKKPSLSDQANFSMPPETPPAPPEVSALKGKKAFQTPLDANVPKKEDVPTPPPAPPSGSLIMEEFKGDVKDIRLEIARQMRDQLPALVKESIESYCAIHFPKITREIVTAELRRLADEKARHLIDN